MAITYLDRHNDHMMQIHLTRPGVSKHWAALRCQQCNCHVQWLSKSDTESLINWGVTVNSKTYVPKKKRKELL
jgi:hypothetical protein